MQNNAVVCWTMALLGVALLLPWNAHIKAIPYLRLRLSDTRFQDSFPNYIAATFSSFNTFTSLVLAKVSSQMKASSEQQIFIGLVCNIVLAAVACGFPLTDWAVGESWLSGSHYFVGWLTLIAVTGMITAMLQKSGYGLAGRMPAHYAPWFSGGQAMAGVLVSMAALLADLFDSGNAMTLKLSFGYFVVALVLLMIALLLFLYSCNRQLEGLCLQSDLVRQQQQQQKGDGQALSFNLFKTISWFCMGIWLNFFITLSLFPFTIVMFKTDLPLFIPLAFLTFDAGDLIGRSMPSWVPFEMSTTTSLALPWLRLVFFPLLLCGKFSLDSTRASHHLYESPYLFFLFMFLFSVTSGLAASLLLMQAPGRVTDAKHKEAVGSMISLFLVIGIFMGSNASVLWRRLVVV